MKDDCITSIIVPVFNGSQYVEQFLKYMDSQMEASEMIMVVDSKSTDESIKLCESLKYDRPWLKVIVQNDDGKAGGARNIGINNSTGKYIGFLDIDDVPYPNYVQTLSSILEKTDADVVFCKYVTEFHDEYEYHNDYSTISVDEAIIRVTINSLPGMPWGSMWKRSLINEFSIQFPLSSVAEDTAFILMGLSVSKTVAVYEHPLYIYKESDNSRDERYNVMKRGQVYYSLVDYMCKNRPSIADDYSRVAYIVQIRWAFNRPRQEFKDYVKSDFATSWRRRNGRNNRMELIISTSFPFLYQSLVRMMSKLLNVLNLKSFKERLY